MVRHPVGSSSHRAARTVALDANSRSADAIAVRPDLPTGTVTFLFTDVEGSTRLLHELGADAYAAALADHRRVVREACASRGGVEVDTQGDAFFFAFPTAPAALEAAQSITEALEPGPIRVRIGVHTGTPLVTDEGYVGEDVHRAARIAATGHGGQVIVSSATAALVDQQLRDLGEHRLKDLTAPQRIHQLGLDDHPPLRSLRLTNLPIPATPFVGRQQELAEVVEALTHADLRMLTLTGPGGTGKTRLAAQAAGLAADVFPDGVWWVPLATLHDPALVLPTAAQVVGARDELHLHVGDRRTVMLFDNFEHLVAAADDLSALLGACPNLRLLVTSREPLHLAGEQEYPVRPFAHPDAVAFFLTRARAVQPGVVADAAIDEICRRLDELPLALELAAARVKALSTAGLLERLEQRLPLLTGGPRDAPERQRTLRATIEWSYELLSPGEQQLFASLSVFAGGWSLEAAEEVVHAELDTLQSLVDKSLVRFTGERYWMLETIREFASSLLGEAERELLRTRHLDFCLALVSEAEPELTGRDQQRWLERLAAEQDNIREALAFACDFGDGERALMLAGTFWRFWWVRGQIEEAARWYERAFAVGGDASDRARARALFGFAHVAEARDDVPLTRLQFGQAADLLRRVGESRWLVLALTHLAGAHTDTGDIERAEAIHLEALALAEETGDRRGIAIVRSNLGDLALSQGDLERASSYLRSALDGHVALGDAYGIASTLSTLASIELFAGDVDDAARDLGESMRLSRGIGSMYELIKGLSIAAAIVLARGRASDAARLLACSEVLAAAAGYEGWAKAVLVLGDTKGRLEAVLAERYAAEAAAGAALDLDAAVELALEALGGSRHPPPLVGPGTVERE